MKHHLANDSMILLDIQMDEKNLLCEVCWLDRYAPAEIEVPDFGKFKIPESAQGQKTSLILLEVVLYPV